MRGRVLGHYVVVVPDVQKENHKVGSIHIANGKPPGDRDWETNEP